MAIGFYSYLVSAVAFLLFSLLLATSWRKRVRGHLLVFACVVTAVWAAILALQAWFNAPPSRLIWSVEIIHTTVWLIFFQQLLSASVKHRPDQRSPFKNFQYYITISATCLMLFVWVEPLVQPYFTDFFAPSFQLVGHIVMALIGMVLIEQLYRNTRADQRWNIKFICLAVGGMFAYDFYLYSDALLFRRLNPDIWVARGAVVSLMVPLIAVSAARNRDWAVDIFISRGVVFYSASLLGAGVYLLLMAISGYYIKLYGGEWGAVVQIIFFVGAFLLLSLLLFSGQLRSKIRVFLSKNFFSYAYDYREEWLNIISTLSETGTEFPLEQRAILALAELVESPAGVLWISDRSGNYILRADYGDPGKAVERIKRDDKFVVEIVKNGWVINLDEMARSPEMYANMYSPEWLANYPKAWVIVPLFQSDHLYGLMMLTQSRANIDWNWEVIELLKTAGKQAASYLALEDAAAALSEARQYEGFNRLSAFVMHDLKNLIAQLSLVVRNAERHQDNPEFMQDAIKTVDHSVGKMSRLMSQLKNAGKAAANTQLNLIQVVTEAVKNRTIQIPVPSFEVIGTCNPEVFADGDRLASTFEHVIQNAQDAAGKKGKVHVRLEPIENKAIVYVDDNGHGMDENFIRTRLFKPFETTKGVTGMGIGAYESREYVRSLGGEMHVQSEVDWGTVFSIVIPLIGDEQHAEEKSEGVYV